MQSLILRHTQKKCMCSDKFWVMYESIESYFTPKTNITEYVNYTRMKM